MALEISKKMNITKNKMKLTENKVLITGGTKGIGLALAQKFLELGNKVIIVGRNENDLANIKAKFPEISIFRCDLANKEDLNQLTLYIKNQHPDLNILINNAGVQYNYEFLNELELLQKIEYEININFHIPIKLTALLLPILEANINSAIINVSSGLAFVPKMQAPIYCGTKAGIHIFSKSLRYQLNKVKVFEIIPPLVDTAMTKGRGKGKISTKSLVNEFIKGFKKNKYEMSIGKVKLLRALNRISPSIADRLMKKGI